MNLLTSQLRWRSSWGACLGALLAAPFACTPGSRDFVPTDMGGTDGDVGSGAASTNTGGDSSGGGTQSGGAGPSGGNGPTSGGAGPTGGSGPTGGTGGGSGGGSTTGPCEDHECQNGGACFPNGDDAYTCGCDGTGFSGDFCEDEINECDPSPCEQSATCNDLINDYDCDCPSAFAGKNCELASFEAVPSGFTLYDMSADGTVLVGQGGTTAARYLDGEIDDLGAYIGDTWAVAYAASRDGSVIVGGSENSSGTVRRAIIWEQGTMDQLDPHVDFPNCTATGVSLDGTIIVGMCADADFYNATIVRWVDGELEDLGTAGGTTWCFDALVSGDGASVFASCSEGSSVALMRWTEADGAVLLQSPEVGCRMQAVSPDGQIGAGWCSPGGNSSKGFEWTPADGFDLLEGDELLDPTDGITSANDMSGDGTFIVGETGNLGDGVLSVVWDANRTPQLLTQIIQDENIDTTDWSISDLDTVSEDGLVMAGRGQYMSSTRIWILRLD